MDKDKNTAVIGRIPEKLSQRRKIPRLPLIIIAILIGLGGAYAIITSLAATQTSNCFSGPSSCGYPDATNTGVPAGTILTPSGSLTASTPGQVIDGKDVTGSIMVTASNVTIENTRVTQNTTCGSTNACGNYAIGVAATASNVTIKNVETRTASGQTCQQDIRSGGSNLTITNSYLHACDGNLYAVAPATLKDSYALARIDISTDHIENIYMSDTTVNVNHSTLFNPVKQTATIFGNVNGGQGGTCANHITANNSFLVGGGYTVYACAHGTGAGSSSAVITGNRFARCLGTETVTATGGNHVCQSGSDSHGYYPNGGSYGLVSDAYSNATTWSGNIWDDNGQSVCANGSSGCGGSAGTTNPPPADTTAPTVSITVPSNNATVSGSNVTISANASDNTGVAGVQFKLDGNNLGSEDTSSPYSTTWDTTKTANGSHTLTAVAHDAAGNTTTSNSVKVTASNDNNNAACTTTISPGDASTVQSAMQTMKPGQTLCLRGGTYSGNIKITVPAGSSTAPITMMAYPGERPIIEGLFWITSPTYWTFDGINVTWNSSTSGSGDHMVKLTNGHDWTWKDSEVWGAHSYADMLVAGTASGQPSNWRVTNSCIHDTYPTNDTNQDHNIYANTGITAGAGSIDRNLLFNATNGENIKVAGASAGQGSNNITIDHNTMYNAAQNILIGWATSNTLITNNLADLAGSNNGNVRGYELTGTNNVAKNNAGYQADSFISNYVGGNGVADGGGNQFPDNPNFSSTTCGSLVNGKWTGFASNLPYGYHGSSTETTPPPPPGSPDTTKPTVSFSSPSNSATVSGIVTATATASDNVGVSKVEFSLDGSSTPAVVDTSSPYNYSFDSKTLGNGSHTITAKAYDAAGNSSSSTITLKVNNPDTMPPSAPSSVKATASNATTVNLTWSASSDSGTNATGVAKYNILRNGVVVAQVTTTSYTDTGAVASTTYKYAIQAVDGAGNVSANSAAASVTTPKATPTPDTTPPSVPSSLKATAANATQVNLTWNASTDSGGSGLAGYNVYRDGDKLNSSPVTSVSYGDSTVNDSTTYTYRIEAVDGAGNKSSQTKAVSVVTPSAPDTTPPSVPSSLKATAANATQVNLTWNASTDSGGSGLAGYNVYRDGQQLNTAPLASTSYYDAKVSPDTTYKYTVQAVDKAGNTSDMSGSVQVTTPSSPTTGNSNHLLLGSSKIQAGSDNDSTGSPEAFKYKATASGQAGTISLYVDRGSAAVTVIAGLYSDRGGKPGVLLTSGSINSPASAAWNTITLSPNLAITKGATYWIALLGVNGTVNFRDALSGNCSQSPVDDNLSSLPASWNTGPRWRTCTLSAYVSSSSSPSGGHNGGSTGTGDSNHGGNRSASKVSKVTITITGSHHHRLANATVTLNGQTVRTNRYGAAQFTNVPIGKQRVSIDYGNNKTATKSVRVKASSSHDNSQSLKVSLASVTTNPLLLLVPVVALLAAGLIIFRPWNGRLGRVAGTVPEEQIISSSHPADDTVKSGRKLEAPGTVYGPSEHDDRKP